MTVFSFMSCFYLLPQVSVQKFNQKRMIQNFTTPLNAWLKVPAYGPF